MSSERPPEPPAGESQRFESLPAEAREVRVRETLSALVPVMLEAIQRRMEKNLEDLSPAESEKEDAAGMEDVIRRTREHASFLEELSARELEDRILHEWQQGDETLLLTALAMNVAVKDVLLGRIERGGEQETAKEASFIMEEMRDVGDQVDAELAWLVSASKRFMKHLVREDFIRWVQEREEIIRKAPTAKSPIAAAERVRRYALLDRVLSGRTERGDGHALQAMIEGELELELLLVEDAFLEALMHSAVRSELETRVRALLDLHQLRALAAGFEPGPRSS